MQSISRNCRVQAQRPRDTVEGEEKEGSVGIGAGEQVMQLHCGMKQDPEKLEHLVSC